MVNSDDFSDLINDNPVLEQLLFRVCTQNKIKLLKANAEIEGYGWYDDIPRILNFAISAFYDDGCSYLICDIPDKYLSFRPSKVMVNIELKNSSSKFTREFPLEYCILESRGRTLLFRPFLG